MGVTDAPSYSQKQSDARFASGRTIRSVADRTHALLRSGTNNLSDGVVTQLTSRLRHNTVTATSDLRLVYANFYDNAGTDAAGLNPITIKASLQIDGIYIPVYFNGSRTITIDAGGIAVSDPIGVALERGYGAVTAYAFYTRTLVQVTSGGKFPLGVAADGVNEWAVTGDSVDSGSITTNTAYTYGPSAILGLPAVSSTSPVIGVLGDSRVAGQNDSTAAGWVHRAFARKYSNLKLATSGSTVQAFTVFYQSRFRYALAAVGGQKLTDIVVAYGINDLNNGRTAAQLIADLTTLYGQLLRRGVRVWGCTIEPTSTSTDGWLTTANQTVGASNAARIVVNDWIRTKPAPLSGYFELADVVETARNSGIWKTDGTSNGRYTIDGTHETDSAYQTIANTVDFSALGTALTA